MKGGNRNAEAYLSETVLVQNALPELRTLRRRYAARAVPPGGPEKESSRWGQAERLRETAFSACVVRQLPPLDEALGTT